jgi:hypothetical protein
LVTTNADVVSFGLRKATFDAVLPPEANSELFGRSRHKQV